MVICTLHIFHKLIVKNGFGGIVIKIFADLSWKGGKFEYLELCAKMTHSSY